MRRLVLIASLLVSLTMGTTTVVDAAPAKTTELRIATQPAPLYAPIFIAKQKHWLEDELRKDGITVKWSSFVAGPPENESFAAGQQDIGFIGDTPVIIARAAGLDTRIVGTAVIGPKALALVATRKSGIKTLADLKGKRVAVTKGSYAHHLLYLLLQKAKLNADDVKLIHLPPAYLVNAFNHGDVDAAVTWEPFLSKIEENGTRIADGTGIKQGLCVIFARQEYARANPQIVASLLKAYQRGYDFLKAHPQEAARLVAPETRLPPEQIVALFSKLDFSPVIRAGNVQELKRTEEFLRTSSLSRSRVDIDSFIDAQYLKQAGLK
jgi:sulfonate transport system substrate-binding protein